MWRGIDDPEPHQQDAQQPGGGAEGEEIAVAEGGQPAAKEGDDDIDGADDGIGGADVGGALLRPYELEHDHEAGDEGGAEIDAEEQEDQVVEERIRREAGDDIGRGGGEPAENERRFVSFAVGQQPEEQIADRLADQQGDGVVADGAARDVPFADGGQGNEGHAHAADGQQAAGDEEAAEVLIPPQDPAQPGPDAETVLVGGRDLAHGLTRKGQDCPAEEHEDGSQPEQDEEIAGEGQCIQNAAAADGAQGPGGAAYEHGYAHHAPAARGGKTDGDQVLPCGSDDAGAEVVDGKCQQEECQGPGG